MPRLTSHGEVVFHQSSNGRTEHPFWGQHANWWPGPVEKPAMAQPGCGTCGGQPAQPQFKTLDEWFAAAAAQPSDVNEHMPVLRDLARKCNIVVEISRWNKPALLAFAAAKPKKLVSVCFGNKEAWPQLRQLSPPEEPMVLEMHNVEQQPGMSPQPSDLLFIDTWHQADVLYSELSVWAPLCSHYIVVHCTEIFGETGDNGGPGVLPALRRYLAEHREWSAVRRDRNNNGLMVLSRDDADKQQPPGTLRKALNFAKALAAHAVDGNRLVDDATWEKRLELCIVCEHRNGDQCGKCGCPVSEKSSWASSFCPDIPPRWTRE